MEDVIRPDPCKMAASGACDTSLQPVSKIMWHYIGYIIRDKVPSFVSPAALAQPPSRALPMFIVSHMLSELSRALLKQG